MNRTNQWVIGLMVAWPIVLGLTQSKQSAAQDELTRGASWSVPDQDKIESAFSNWMDETSTAPEVRRMVIEVLSQDSELNRTQERLTWVIHAMEVKVVEIKELRLAVEANSISEVLNAYRRILDSKPAHDFVRKHASLLVFRWMVRHKRLDEAIELSDDSKLSVSDVLDPASLLFYRGVAQHQLLNVQECVASLNRLLENEGTIPRRFSVLAKMMTADVAQLKPDSLDEVARMMTDIERRQRLFRSGKRVRDEEEEVIRKLDKIIEDLEKEQQQSVASTLVPSNPMQDSQGASGRGSGEVDNREISHGKAWGDLPPAQRAAALAEMAADLPPHYRAVIEEYFRKLANDEQK